MQQNLKNFERSNGSEENNSELVDEKSTKI